MLRDLAVEGNNPTANTAKQISLDKKHFLRIILNQLK